MLKMNIHTIHIHISYNSRDAPQAAFIKQEPIAECIFEELPESKHAYLRYRNTRVSGSAS